MPKTYAIALTFNCNWNCEYCAINNAHDRKTVSHEDILKKIYKIDPLSNVILSGGEPGLIEENKIRLYISELKKKNCTLYLETNGLFIVKYRPLLNEFKEILYHCSINLDPDIEIIDLKEFDHIRYLIILTDNNVKSLDRFVDKYRHLKFDMIEATYPYEITGPTLSKENKHHIMVKYCNKMTKQSLKRFIEGKNFEEIEWLY